MQKKSQAPTASALRLEQLYSEHEGWALDWAAWFSRGLTKQQRRAMFEGQIEQAARIALWKCLKRWNPKRSSFRYYANGRILGALKDEFQRGGHHDMRRKRPIQLENNKKSAPTCGDDESPRKKTWSDWLAKEPKPDCSEELMKYIDHCASPRSRLVLEMMYADDMQLVEVANVLRLSISRVCEIHREAIEEIRRALCKGK